MSGSLPIQRGLGGLLPSQAGLQGVHGQTEPLQGPGDSRPAPPKADAGALPASLRGAAQGTGPRLQRYGWAEGLKIEARSGQSDNLLREARAGTLKPLPLGKSFVDFARNKVAREDIRLGSLTIWRRDGRYKTVLRQAEELGRLYEAKPGTSAAERRGQLQTLRAALADFDQAVRSYQQRASPIRRDLMAELSDRTRIEIGMLDRIEADLASGHQTLAAPVGRDHVSQLLDYSRAGLAPDDALSARQLGIDEKTAASALQHDRAVAKQLPLSTLALLIRHHDPRSLYSEARNEFQRADDIEALTKLHVAGWSDQDIDQALTLCLTLEQLADRPRDPVLRASIAPRWAALQALAEAQSPGQDLLGWYPEERVELIKTAETYRTAHVPPEWLGPAWVAGLRPDEVRSLIDTGLANRSFTAAVAAPIPPSDLLAMAHNGPPVEEIAALMRLRGESLEAARQDHASLPDDAALGWLRRQPESGRSLSRAEAWALQAAGLPEGSLPMEDLVGLVDLGVSAAGIAALGQSPPEPARLGAMLALAGKDGPAFSRAEALLLAGAGWPADAQTLAVFGARYDNGRAIVPIHEATVLRDLGRFAQEGSAALLGSGQFNKVYGLTLVEPGSPVQRPAVFKPLQRVNDDDRLPSAVPKVGISRNAPRYELRNLAHSQLDRLLGFDVVPHCELGVVDGQAGLLMARAEGQTAARVGKWDPPVDITDSDLGFQLVLLLRHGNDPKTIEAYAAHKRVEIKIEGPTDDPTILLTKGLYAPRIDPSDAAAQKSLIALQWLHAISGATDGHDMNIVRSDDGHRFMGIDNDIGFGSKTRHPDDLKTDGVSYVQPFHGKGLPPIADRSQYRAIMDLSPERLRAAIGNLISPAEFQATLARLEVVQAHLDSLEQTGQVIADNAWDDQSFQAIQEAAVEKGQPSYLTRLVKRHALIGVDSP